MYWALMSVALGQGASLLSQLILGYKLNSEFALNMVAIAAFATIGILRDAGLRKIAIVRGAQFANLAHPLFVLGLIVNLIAAVLLSAAAPWLAYHGFQKPQPSLMPMLWITAASFVISSFGVMQSAKLAIDMRFKAIAIQGVASGMVRQASQAAFALMGFAELSFALPMLLVATFDAITLQYLAGSLPRGGKLTWALVRDIFRDTKWIMLTVLGMTLAYRADGFIVAKFEDFNHVVMFYAWAVVMTFQVLQPFTYAIYTTVMPVFTKMADEVPRLAQAYLRMIGVVSFISIPAVITICALVPFAIHIMPLWHGKWDPAIPVVVLFLIATPMKSLQACAMALDESQSRFARTAMLNIGDGITSLTAVAIGVAVGGMVEIGIAVFIQRALYGVFHCIYSGTKAGLTVGQLLGRIWPPVLLGTAIGVLMVATIKWGPHFNAYYLAAALTLPAVGLYVLVSRLLMSNLWSETRAVILMRNR